MRRICERRCFPGLLGAAGATSVVATPMSRSSRWARSSGPTPQAARRRPDSAGRSAPHGRRSWPRWTPPFRCSRYMLRGTDRPSVVAGSAPAGRVPADWADAVAAAARLAAAVGAGPTVLAQAAMSRRGIPAAARNFRSTTPDGPRVIGYAGELHPRVVADCRPAGAGLRFGARSRVLFSGCRTAAGAAAALAVPAGRPRRRAVGFRGCQRRRRGGGFARGSRAPTSSRYACSTIFSPRRDGVRWPTGCGGGPIARSPRMRSTPVATRRWLGRRSDGSRAARVSCTGPSALRDREVIGRDRHAFAEVKPVRIAAVHS